MHGLEGLENWMPQKISVSAAPVGDGVGGGHLSESRFRSQEMSLEMKKLSEEKARGRDVSVAHKRAGRHVAQCSSMGIYLTQGEKREKLHQQPFPEGLQYLPEDAFLQLGEGISG